MSKQPVDEIEEIIDYAKGNFFPVSNLLRHALAVAKKVEDKQFEEFIICELKGCPGRRILPEYRKLRGRVIAFTPDKRLQQVNVDNLDAEALQKVSTGYVGETIPALEELVNFEGMITVGFSPENEGKLPPPSNQVEYQIQLSKSQIKELLDNVRMIVLDWSIKKQLEIVKNAEDTKAEPLSTQQTKRLPLQYVKDNKQWIFSGIGVYFISIRSYAVGISE